MIQIPILVLCSALSVSLSAFASTWAEASKAPNIVFVLLDDLDQVVTEPYYKDVLPQTMALMEDEGMRFTNTFATTPLCCPARAAILSGCYAHNTGVYSNGGRFGGWEHFKDDEPRAIAAQLQKAGYRTFMDGKYLNGHHSEHPIPYGWTDGSVLASPNLQKYKGYDYEIMNWTGGQAVSPTVWTGRKAIEKRGSAPIDYSTDVVKAKAIDFFRHAKKDNDAQPFFAYVAPTCPHLPLPPAPRHRARAARFGAGSFPTQRPNYFRDDGVMERSSQVNAIPLDKPSWIRDTWEKRSRLQHWGARALKGLGGDLPPDTRGWDALGFNEADWYNRMGSLLACDEMVGEMVSWLKDNDEWDNTLFIFTSDNGYNLGAHSLSLKIVPYEESLRVPLYVAGGALKQKKKTSLEWFLSIDFTPTLLELAGLSVPTHVDGESHAALLKARDQEGAKKLPRDQFLIEYRSPGVAEGHLEDFEYLHYMLMPSFFLDVPGYDAIRARRMVMDLTGNQPVAKEKDYLFVRWQPILGKTQVEYELYDIDADPYQRDNLLYYQRSKYIGFANLLETDMNRLAKCQGSGRDRSCVAAAHTNPAPVVFKN